MVQTHDPYLNTVKRSLSEQKHKIRKEKMKEAQEESKSFLSKNIKISDYIYLPENLQNFFLLSLFILIPYSFGILILLILMGYDAIQEHTTLNFDRFMLTWTVGYESIALILLLLIMKSAFTFKKR